MVTGRGKAVTFVRKFFVGDWRRTLAKGAFIALSGKASIPVLPLVSVSPMQGNWLKRWDIRTDGGGMSAKAAGFTQGLHRFALPFRKCVDVEGGFARAHALWTLDGMGVWDESLVLHGISDKNVEVRLAALRVAGERILYHEASDALLEAVSQSLPDDALEVATQRLLSLSLHQKQTKAFAVRPGHTERVMKAAGEFIDKPVLAKAFMVALNPVEYLPALQTLSGNPRFHRKDHPLPQHLGFAGLAQAEEETLGALLSFAAEAPVAFRDAVLEGFRLGSKAGKYISVDLIRLKSKPSGLTAMEKSGVSEYALAILHDQLTWPGDPKFKLQKALPPLSKPELARFNQGREIYQGLLCGMPRTGRSGSQNARTR